MGSSNMFALVTTLSVLVLSSTPACAVSETELAENKTLGETSEACPEKWLDASFMEMGCLFFNNTAGGSWEEAYISCKKYSNATLVEIQSEMQMGFLKMELDVIANAEGTKHHWWTAGTDVGREGQWYWATTLTEVGDFVWKTSEPNNGITFNCLYLDYGSGYEGRDQPCDNAAMNPICQ